MEKISVDVLYSYFCSALEHCGLFLLNSSDADVEYHIFEEFDVDCISFLSDSALDALLSANYISQEMYGMALKIAASLRKLENTNLWNVESVKKSKEWRYILSLTDALRVMVTK